MAKRLARLMLGLHGTFFIVQPWAGNPKERDFYTIPVRWTIQQSRIGLSLILDLWRPVSIFANEQMFAATFEPTRP